MTHDEYLAYQTQYRRDHGIKPMGWRKTFKRKRLRLAEMSPKKLQHIAISTSWIEAVNEKLRRLT